MRKRSGPLTLLLMASTAITLSGCGDDPQTEGHVYRNLEACIADGSFTEADCKAGYEEATRQNEETAPRYDSRALCEQQHGFGNCAEPTHHRRGSFWTPFIAGYFVSQLIDGRPLGGWGNRTRPVYNGSDGYWYTADGSALYRTRSGRVSVSERSMSARPKPAKVQTRTTVAARGGFGARSSAAS